MSFVQPQYKSDPVVTVVEKMAPNPINAQASRANIKVLEKLILAFWTPKASAFSAMAGGSKASTEISDSSGLFIQLIYEK